ncbi:glycosyltransferase family 1 protein [Microbacterium sp.]|uniref:glycosyltransferase family 4 protein n=1 Tax=Microbacterium sp. TaxID=51671 RepID=UPI0025E0C5C4|nr:glycosyltransferase family 1 protein [Microbacterium sp.]
MPVRVLVDFLFYTGTRGGTETYTREVVKRLPEALPGSQLIALANRAGASGVRDFFPGDVRVARCVGADRATWALGEVLAANKWARRVDADVMWSPANFGPISRSAVPRVTTTHDTTYQLNAKQTAVTRVTSWLQAKAALTADAVITGSAAAKADVVKHIGIDAGVITVIPHGTAAPEAPADPWSQLIALGIQPGRPLVLSTGNRLPHKNFEALLAAVATMDEHRRPLVVLPGGRGRDALEPLIHRLRLEHDVILPGWVTPPQLEALYAVASLYVCPSLTEGFGLPVIDAMRRGCVVLANDVPVLREVGGDVALYADARSERDLSTAISSALSQDPSLRRDAGIRRAGTFTWERAAAETARVLEAAVIQRRMTA